MKTSRAIIIFLIFLLGILVSISYRTVIRKNGIISQKVAQIDSLKNQGNYIIIDFGYSLFKTNCRMCHASKFQTDNHLEGIVDKLGEHYIELYLTRQDSLIHAKDKYAEKVKMNYGNMGNSHNFKFSKMELKAIVEYLKSN